MPSYDPFIEDEETDTPRANSAPFKQLRDHAKKLEKELKDRDKELDELREFKASQELRVKRELLRQSFSTVGLNEKHAELFEAARPDVEPTPEAVKAFAVEYGFLDAASDPAAEEDESEGSFGPTPPSGVPASQRRFTNLEFEELYKSNPVEAIKAAEEGRVDFQKGDFRPQ